MYNSDEWDIILHGPFHDIVSMTGRLPGFGHRGGDPLGKILPLLVRKVDDIFTDASNHNHDKIWLDGNTVDRIMHINKIVAKFKPSGINLNAGANLCMALMTGAVYGSEWNMNGHFKERATEFLGVEE
jgi:hypothetical protein